jgi:hypothetical protein
VFTGGTPPYTASLYLSSSNFGLIFVTSSSSTGTSSVLMVPNMCYTASTYWTLDAYDANGCQMTNYMTGAQLYVPTKVTAQQPVCYSTGATDINVCGCASGSYETFYISSSNTTSSFALLSNYVNFIASGTLIYTDCKLTSLVPSGSYYDENSNVVDFSPLGSGTLVSYDPCAIGPIAKQISVSIQNIGLVTSQTFFSTTFESTNPDTHNINIYSYNTSQTVYYTIAQSGYLDINGEVTSGLTQNGSVSVTISVLSGSAAPNSDISQFYINCVNASELSYMAPPFLFIDEDYNYAVIIQYEPAFDLCSP